MKRADRLATEIAWFEVHRHVLAVAHPRHFVLVKGKRFHGVYPTRESALGAGYDLFGNSWFLVRQCLEVVPAVVMLHA